MENNNFIWLFGENLSETANNNSFYFWKHVVNREDGIEKFLILTKSEKNIKIYNEFSDNEKRHVIWRNSLRHLMAFRMADMFFVSLSYRDILPEKILGRNIKFVIKKPLIYLQHGTLLIKKIGYHGSIYYNNMFRFIYYNKSIKDVLKTRNDFKDYQLYYGEYHPRYKQLAKMHLDTMKTEKKQILWFLTWREYLGKNLNSKLLIRKIKSVLKNKELQEYLKKNGLTLKICLHQFFNNEIANVIKENNIENVVIAKQSETDIMKEIVESKLLITDYSSLCFDFTILNKPVILFQPDLEEYLQKRELYCEIDELKQYNVEKSGDLVNTIVNEKYTVNQFVRKRCPEKIDYKYLSKGKHIDKMYEDFKNIQENKITFLGYNFYGVGGTVSATKALAEGLLEQGYMVEVLSLKKTGKIKNFPYALNNTYIYVSNSKRLYEKIKRNIIISKKHFKYLVNDSSLKVLKPYAGYKLTKILKNIKSKTVISTRDSLHLFLKEATSPNIKNKVYFFHCQADVMEEMFPGLMEKLKGQELEKAVFVTEENKKGIEEKYDYKNYKDYWISGNTLEGRNCINVDDIEAVEPKDVYKAIYLLRMSEDRKEDLNNLVDFGKYLKEKKVTNLVIDVFGSGEYTEKFLDLLEENDLMDIIHYKGRTGDPPFHIRRHDFMIDFSLKQSFGMTYLESVLNGKMVFCTRNTGSLEVLKDIEGCYYDSYEDLLNKINDVTNITKERLQDNYTKIWNKYSREKMAKEFIKYIEK